MQIQEITPNEIEGIVDDLSQTLIETVHTGGAIGFMSPVPVDIAHDFWMNTVRQEIERGHRKLFVALIDGRAVGSVQLLFCSQANQPHRCEVAKMMVHPNARQRGVGKALMQVLTATAIEQKKSLITLDTKIGDVAETLYRAFGFESAGIIPNYAYDPDGNARHSTLYMYKLL